MKFFASFSFLVFLDQLSKWWIVQQEDLPLVLFPSYLFLVDVRNRGMAFGLGNDISWFPFLVFFFALVFLFAFVRLWNSSLSQFGRWGLILMASGVLGNLIDRIFRGQVVDFIDFVIPFLILIFPSSAGHFPAFNLADSYLCLGVFFFLLSSLLQKNPL